MNSHTRTDIIPKIQKYLATQPVERAWLFGSYSRREEHKDSNVDILVDFTHKSVEQDKILIYERAN